MRARLEACPLTLLVALISLAASLPVLVPGDGLIQAALELRDAFTVGSEPWRLVTCHLVHLNGRQLLMNLIAFLWLGILCEPKMHRRYGMLLFASSLAVGVGVLHVHPDLAGYRGLSGIASAQFAALVALRWRETRLNGRVAAALSCVVALLLFMGKTIYEVETGRALFASGLELDGAGPSPVAHLFGALAGLAVALLPAPATTTPEPQCRAARGPAARVG